MAQKPGHTGAWCPAAGHANAGMALCPPEGKRMSPTRGHVFPELERLGCTLWPGHHGSLGQMGRGGGGKTLGVVTIWAGTALPAPEPSTQGAGRTCLLVQELPCTPHSHERHPARCVLLCEATCWGPMPTGSSLEFLVRLQAQVLPPKASAGQTRAACSLPSDSHTQGYRPLCGEIAEAQDAAWSDGSWPPGPEGFHSWAADNNLQARTIQTARRTACGP